MTAEELNQRMNIRNIRASIRDKEYEARAYEDAPTEGNEEPERHVLHLYFSDDELGVILELLEKQRAKLAKEIQGIEDKPSWSSVRDALRIEIRRKAMIPIDYIIAQFTENA